MDTYLYETHIEVVGGSYTSEFGRPLVCYFGADGEDSAHTSAITVENSVSTTTATDDMTSYIGKQLTRLDLNLGVDHITFNNLQIKLFA